MFVVDGPGDRGAGFGAGRVAAEAGESVMITRHGKPAGIHVASSEYATRMIDEGYRFVTLSSDARLLAERAGQVVDAVRKTSGGGQLPAY